MDTGCCGLVVCVLQALLRETGKRPSADADLQRTSEVSLTALLDNGGFYHPVSMARCLCIFALWASAVEL